jgi:hypothetical protein
MANGGHYKCQAHMLRSIFLFVIRFRYFKLMIIYNRALLENCRNRGLDRRNKAYVSKRLGDLQLLVGNTGEIQSLILREYPIEG